MAGYTRNDTSNNIATGNVINAADLDGEFDALVAAFHASTGHTHDGTAANGAPITKIGPAQDLVISTGAITPKTDNTVDLGSSSFEFKDLYIDGTANIDALVADTADINAGTIDGTTIGGSTAAAGSFTTLTTSSTVTLNGGTANGVLYLNGSKVATSGSALTFDGSTLNTKGQFRVTDSTNAANYLLFGSGANAPRGGNSITAQTSTFVFGTETDNPNIFIVNGSEQMRLTSTGLGIGTSSPDQKVHAYNTASNTWFRAQSGGDNSVGLYMTNSQRSWLWGVSGGGVGSIYLYDLTGSKEVLNIDSSGNLGLGVTPSAWTAYKAFQIGLDGSVFADAGSSEMNIGQNVRYDGSFKYINTQAAGRYRLYNGQHAWFTAPSGTAGNAITFTQAMTLDASGNLLVGTTSQSWGTSGRGLIEVNGSSSFLYGGKVNGTQTGYLAGTSSVVEVAAVTNIPITFLTNNTERARITSGGKFLIGTASSVGTLTVDAVDAISTGSSSTYAITCGNDVADGLAFGSDASYAYIQSFGSRKLVINKEGNEVLVAGTTDNGAYNLQCNGTGVWGAGAYVNGSDERLKDNIQTLNDGLAVVSQLRPVTFQYKPEHSKDQSVQPGFIAQELQQAMAGKNYVDGVVQSGPEYLNVAYQNLIPILTKAIQEQQALINDLRSRLAAAGI